MLRMGYRLTGSSSDVIVPLKGSISVTRSHVFGEVELTQLRNDPNMGIPRPDAGHIKLALVTPVSGCDVTDGNTLQASMAQFWK